jgi:hypothetical protein
VPWTGLTLLRDVSDVGRWTAGVMFVYERKLISTPR